MATSTSAVSPAWRSTASTSAASWSCSRAFRRRLNDRVRSLPEPLRRQAVLLMVATTAAAEHFTASLAGYVLSDNTWGDTDVDPEMAHLFLWHAAEEVEHRHVAYDVYRHIGGGYLRRAAVMVPLAGLVLLGWPLLTSEVHAPRPRRSGAVELACPSRSARRGEVFSLARALWDIRLYFAPPPPPRRSARLARAGTRVPVPRPVGARPSRPAPRLTTRPHPGERSASGRHRRPGGGQANWLRTKLATRAMPSSASGTTPAKKCHTWMGPHPRTGSRPRRRSAPARPPGGRRRAAPRRCPPPRAEAGGRTGRRTPGSDPALPGHSRSRHRRPPTGRGPRRGPSGQRPSSPTWSASTG